MVEIVIFDSECEPENDLQKSFREAGLDLQSRFAAADAIRANEIRRARAARRSLAPHSRQPGALHAHALQLAAKARAIGQFSNAREFIAIARSIRARKHERSPE